MSGGCACGSAAQNSLTFWMTHPKVSFGDILTDRAAASAAIGLSEADLVADVPV